MALDDAVDNLRGAVEDLNPRERRLLVAMGITFLALLVALPFYVVLSSVADMEDENEEIVLVMQDISRATNRLNAERAERQAMERLYTTKAPPLGSFLEERAQEKGLEGLDITDQPEVALGRYTRRSVRASLSRVQLRPLLEMLAEVKNSRFPIAITTIQIDGVRRSGDHNARITVHAYDEESAVEGEK